MKIIHTRITSLPQPELNWGVKRDKATFRMHLPKIFGILLGLGMFGFGFFLGTVFTPTSSFLYLKLGLVAILMVVGGVGAGLTLMTYDVNKPFREKARSLAKTKQEAWERNYLTPYLAERYNLEFVGVDCTENEVKVRQGDEEFSVRLNGVEFSRNREFDWDYYGDDAFIYDVEITSENIGVERSVIQTLAEI